MLFDALVRSLAPLLGWMIVLLALLAIVGAN